MENHCSDVISGDTREHGVLSHDSLAMEGTANNGFVDESTVVIMPQDVLLAAETDVDIGHHRNESDGEDVGHCDGDVGHHSSKSDCVDVGHCSSESECVNICHGDADVGHCGSESNCVNVGHSVGVVKSVAVADTGERTNIHTVDADIGRCRSESDTEDLGHGDADMYRSESEVKMMVVAEAGAHRNVHLAEHTDDERRSVNDIIAANQCRSISDGLDGGRIDEESVACNAPCIVNAVDATNRCRAVSCDENRESMSPADVVITHTLPSYSVSLPNCQPVARHQTSSTLWRRRKLCVECCLHCVVMVTSLRFLLAVVLLTGAGCMAGGIALGAVNMSAGNDFFTLSAVFVGQLITASHFLLTYLITYMQMYIQLIRG